LFTSSRIICPCACAAAQFAGFNIDDPANIYPLYLVWHQPRYRDGCREARLSTFMEYMPHFYPPAASTNETEQHIYPPTAEESMIAFNSQIFDRLGTMDHLNESQRVTKFRELCGTLQDVACQSALHFKHAASAIIASTNQLSSMQKGNTGAIKMSAVERQRGRRAKSAFENKSALRPAKKSKGNNCGLGVENRVNGVDPKVQIPSFSAAAVSKTHCVTCRDYFGEPPEVSGGHRTGSSKCPHRYHNRNEMNASS
jgi:hypothetical protein